jgi:hypothetical protein
VADQSYLYSMLVELREQIQALDLPGIGAGKP